MRRLNRRGFTLVEIMIVVAIIGLLAAIAIPNFVTARATAQTNACLANVRTLNSAATLASFEGVDINGAADVGLTEAELTAALAPTYVIAMPSCPTTGAYTTDANGVVSCSVH